MMLSFLPEWANYLARGIFLFTTLAFTAVVLGRAGRSPYFAFLVIIPYVQIAAVWFFAVCLWPRPDKKQAERK